MSNKPGQANIRAGAALQQRHHLSDSWTPMGNNLDL